MATLDRTAELAPLLGNRFGPGESLIGAFRVDLTSGTDEPADAARREATRNAVRKLAPATESTPGPAARVGEAVLDFATSTSPFDAQFPDLPNPAGVGVTGGPQSLAVWLRDQLGGPAKHVLAVTTARVIVLRDDHGAPQRHRTLQAGQPPLPYVVLAELPRATLAQARHAPKLLSRGRVELRFVDASMLAVNALKSPTAQQLVQALSG